MRDALIRGLCAAAEREPRLVFLTGDLGYKIFDPLRARLGCRFLNAGVAEANMIGVAAGLAMSGLKPVAYSIANFATLRCYEQIRNDLCYNDAAATVVGVGGGFSYGPNGPSHHALEDIAVMRALPNMTVVCPGDPVEAEAAVGVCIDYGRPVYLRLGRAGDPLVHTARPDFHIGRAIWLRRGSDCALISTGGILPVAIQAAERLEAAGVSCSVISMHTVKPLDAEALRSCAEMGPIFTLEEHSLIGGLGSAVAEWMAANAVVRPLRCFGVEDKFACGSGSQSYLRAAQGLTAESVSREIVKVVRERSAC